MNSKWGIILESSIMLTLRIGMLPDPHVAILWLSSDNPGTQSQTVQKLVSWREKAQRSHTSSNVSNIVIQPLQPAIPASNMLWSPYYNRPT